MRHKIHIGNEIKKELNSQKRSVNWLAEEIGHDQSNLRKKLEKPHLNSELIFRISKTMGKDFFVHFSQLLFEETTNLAKMSK